MKLFLLLFSLYSIYNVNVDKDTDFENQIKQAYEEYALVDEYTNNYYDLQLYVGKVKNEIYYGIYFNNKIPNEYKLKLSYGDKIYNLPTTPRGDIQAFAVDLSHTENFSILIYNKNDYYQYGVNNFQNLNTINLEDFSNLDNKLLGSGNGIDQTRIRNDFEFDNRLIIYLVLVSILLTCGCIVLIYYKRNKGMFNSDIKSANVFNFREFLNSVPDTTFRNRNDDYETDEYSANIFTKEDLDSVNTDNVVENKERIVNPTYLWHHYEEEKSDFDIKDHLQKENLPMDYKSASLEDKNKIMLELMRLRDQNKITQDDYLDEISELWKS